MQKKKERNVKVVLYSYYSQPFQDTNFDMKSDTNIKLLWKSKTELVHQICIMKFYMLEKLSIC